MADLSTSEEHFRTPKSRPYRMRRRAEQVDETRQRITEAVVRLHTTVGPANTTIAGVANEAGVTRLTVYRHFEDLDELFEACMTHWAAANPIPDIDAWREIPRSDERARRAFGDLYAWYGEHAEELLPIYRDIDALPESAQRAEAAVYDEVAAAIVTPDIVGPDGTHPGVGLRSERSVITAIARHLVDFRTWRSLVIERGLTIERSAEAAVAMLLAVHGDPDAPGPEGELLRPRRRARERVDAGPKPA